MKNLALLINSLFLLTLVGCNGAEFAGSRNNSAQDSPPIVICDDEKGCDPEEDPGKDPEKDPEQEDPCENGDCNDQPDPCEELYFEDYDKYLEECKAPCEGYDCKDFDDDPGQNDDPSQNGDDDPSQR